MLPGSMVQGLVSEGCDGKGGRGDKMALELVDPDSGQTQALSGEVGSAGASSERKLGHPVHEMNLRHGQVCQ